MNRKRLIAALGELRAKVALVEDLIEQGDDAEALTVLATAEATWASALEEIRS